MGSFTTPQASDSRLRGLEEGSSLKPSWTIFARTVSSLKP